MPHDLKRYSTTASSAGRPWCAISMTGCWRSADSTPLGYSFHGHPDTSPTGSHAGFIRYHRPFFKARRGHRGRNLSIRKIREVLRLKCGCDLSVRKIARSLDIAHSSAGNYRFAASSLPFTLCVPMQSWNAIYFHRASVVSSEQRPPPDWAELRRPGVTLARLRQEYRQTRHGTFTTTGSASITGPGSTRLTC